MPLGRVEIPSAVSGPQLQILLNGPKHILPATYVARAADASDTQRESFPNGLRSYYLLHKIATAYSGHACFASTTTTTCVVYRRLIAFSSSAWHPAMVIFYSLRCCSTFSDRPSIREKYSVFL